MSIPVRLKSYLEQSGAQFEVLGHSYSRCSAETARTARIPTSQLAKSVIVEDDAGCVMAVVPGNTTVMLADLARLLGRKNLRLSDENRVAALLDGCDRGAVPPVGMAWGIETIVDDRLGACEVVYAEAGDHEHLLRLSQQQFHRLMGSTRHGHFCRSAPH
jgi:Ala-tRNA(Pro) deacylase